MALPRLFTGIVGGAATGLGGIYDTLTPGSGSSYLSDRGQNIMDLSTDAYGTPIRTSSGQPINTLGPVGTSGTGDGTVQSATTYNDPYSQWGGQTNYNNLLSGFNTQRQGIYDTSTESANISARSRQGSIQGFIDDLSRQQRGLDERGVQNELAKKQGHTSILDMVGRGVRSLGTMLGQRNAAGGSAMEQGARAYGDFGRRQMAGIGNQFEQENRQIGLGQEDLERARASGLGNFERDKANQVDSIILQARNQLAALDAAMAEANITERFQIEQEKEAIRSQVSGILSQFDPTLQQGVAGVQPTSQQARQQTAFGLANAGQGATNPFDFTTQVPAAFQNMGGSSSGLPIYTLPRRRENTG